MCQTVYVWYMWLQLLVSVQWCSRWWQRGRGTSRGLLLCGDGGRSEAGGWG